MEILYQKKFSYWTLNKAKNYSLIKDKHLVANSFFKFNKNNIPINVFQKIIRSTNFEKLKKYYGDIFSKVEIFSFETSIVKDADFLIFTNFYQYKNRNMGHFGFKKTRTVSKLKLNLKTGDFLIVKQIHNNIKYYKNSFFSLSLILQENKFVKHVRHSYEMGSFTRELNNGEIEKIFVEQLGGKGNEVEKTLIDFFVKRKNIKIPNNYHNLLKYNYPTKKYLKKNDNKLILSILDSYNIKTKYMVKMAHEYNDKGYIDFTALTLYSNVLYDEKSYFIKQIPFDLFIIQNDYHLRHTTYMPPNFNLTRKEKELVVKVLNDNFYKKSLYTFLVDLYDHVHMKNFVVANGYNFVFNFTTNREFKIEHQTLTSIYSKVKKGFIYNHVYDENLINTIEQVIISKDNNLYVPFILKDEIDYKEEGNIMHHCVYSYASKKECFIISIRKENSKERITCEFNLNGELIQARYFCNGDVPEDFLEPLDIIKARVNNNLLLINQKDMIKKPINENVKILDDYVVEELF